MTHQQHLIGLATASRENLFSKGGFTITSRPGEGVPGFGYLASIVNTERVYSRLPTSGEILNYFQTHPLPDGCYFGGWFDKGKFYLDISRHFVRLSNAVMFAKENLQLAIYDLRQQCVLFVDKPDQPEQHRPSGHVGTSGLRSHSVGDIYPWSIVGKGDTLFAWQLVSGEKREAFPYTPGDSESFYSAYAKAERSIDSCVAG